MIIPGDSGGGVWLDGQLGQYVVDKINVVADKTAARGNNRLYCS